MYEVSFFINKAASIEDRENKLVISITSVGPQDSSRMVRKTFVLGMGNSYNSNYNKQRLHCN